MGWSPSRVKTVGTLGTLAYIVIPKDVLCQSFLPFIRMLSAMEYRLNNTTIAVLFCFEEYDIRETTQYCPAARSLYFWIDSRCALNRGQYNLQATQEFHAKADGLCLVPAIGLLYILFRFRKE